MVEAQEVEENKVRDLPVGPIQDKYGPRSFGFLMKDICYRQLKDNTYVMTKAETRACHAIFDELDFMSTTKCSECGGFGHTANGTGKNKAAREATKCPNQNILKKRVGYNKVTRAVLGKIRELRGKDDSLISQMGVCEGKIVDGRHCGKWDNAQNLQATLQSWDIYNSQNVLGAGSQPFDTSRIIEFVAWCQKYGLHNAILTHKKRADPPGGIV